MSSETVKIIGIDFPSDGWKNKGGNAPAPSKHGTWKKYWCVESDEDWPKYSSIQGSMDNAEVGAHMINPGVQGVWIVPISNRENGLNDTFNLNIGTTVVRANQSLV